MIMSDEFINSEQDNHEWVSMREASRRIGVSTAKLSRMAKQGRINTQANPFDEREKLVDMVELNQIFRRP